MVFNELEQKWIKALVNIQFYNANLGDFIASQVLHDQLIEIDHKDKRINIGVTDEKNINEIIGIIALLEYLEKNNLLYIHKLNNEQAGNVLSSNIDIKYDMFVDKISNKKIDLRKYPVQTSLFDAVVKYINSFVHINHSLVDLVENGFMTTEQRNFKEQIKLSDAQHTEAMQNAQNQLVKANKSLLWSRRSFVIALLTFILSLIIPFIAK